MTAYPEMCICNCHKPGLAQQAGCYCRCDDIWNRKVYKLATCKHDVVIGDDCSDCRKEEVTMNEIFKQLKDLTIRVSGIEKDVYREDKFDQLLIDKMIEYPCPICITGILPSMNLNTKCNLCRGHEKIWQLK